MKGRRGRRLGAAALLLAAAAPAAWLFPYEYEVITGETCLAPAFAGPECAHFRRIAGLDPPRLAPAEPEPPAEVRFPLDVRSLLLSSNELAGTSQPTPVGSQRRR